MPRSHQLISALEKLEHASRYRLVLIIAPQCSGVSNYLHIWSRTSIEVGQLPPLWMNLSDDDNLPNHFLDNLLSTFLKWDPNLQDLIDFSLAKVHKPLTKVP